MVVSRQGDPRANQKQRTRAAILEAAAALLREGTPPTVADAAERALVSRATAYRYFPTQESLLLDVAQVERLIRPVDNLVAAFSTDDVAQRLADLVDTLTVALLSDEAVVRTAVRVYMDTWLANRRDGQPVPVRAGRRPRLIEAALKPIRDQLGETAWKRLVAGLTLTLGTEAVICMKDVAGLDNNDEIVATLRWAAGALLQAALDDSALRKLDRASGTQGTRRSPHHLSAN
jgi:AcrR family transcriptional regulator